MKQNIYDNKDFFSGYKDLRDRKAGFNEVLEQPAILSLIPEIANKAILDIGCGMGDLCRFFAEADAGKVIGVDISSNMLQIARERTRIYSNVQLYQSAIEDFDTIPEQFDLIVSSLALHYVQDLSAVFVKVHKWLKESGRFVFSVEHPFATCRQGIHPGWEKDDKGNNLFWQVDSYSDEGMRKSKWFVEDVVKYHRTISTIINGLIDSSFRIGKVLEPFAEEKYEIERPELKEERRRPPFLLVLASKD